MSIWVVIVAAGSGSRYGGLKQLAPLGDRRVVEWSLEAADKVADGIVVVVPPLRVDELRSVLKADRVVPGGETRTASSKAGVDAVPSDATVIIVHDAARPLASRALFDNVVDAVKAGWDGAVPAIDITDTVKRVDRSSSKATTVLETLDRSEIVSVQTPQAFKADVLRRAFKSELQGPDDASLVEGVGGSVVVVAGEVENIKVTVPSDLERAAAVVNR